MATVNLYTNDRPVDTPDNSEAVEISDLEGLRQALVARGARKFTYYSVNPFGEGSRCGELAGLSELSQRDFDYARSQPSTGSSGIYYTNDGWGVSLCRECPVSGDVETELRLTIADLEGLRQALLSLGAKRFAWTYTKRGENGGSRVGAWFPLAQLADADWLYAKSSDANSSGFFGFHGLTYSLADA